MNTLRDDKKNINPRYPLRFLFQAMVQTATYQNMKYHMSFLNLDVLWLGPRISRDA